MNRPRNRQPRPIRDRDDRGGDRGRGRGRGRGRERERGDNNGPPSRKDYPSFVPNIRQVIPGARVSIVLKQDQPTGREVQGTVMDVLTRGDHPRGIKVRLQDGRVGRVQRMAEEDAPSNDEGNPPVQSQRFSRPQATNDQSGMPPPRTLADFLPSSGDEEEGAFHEQGHSTGTLTTANAVCPICGAFEGDEIAVSHHVESHLT